MQPKRELERKKKKEKERKRKQNSFLSLSFTFRNRDFSKGYERKKGKKFPAASTRVPGCGRSASSPWIHPVSCPFAPGPCPGEACAALFIRNMSSTPSQFWKGNVGSYSVGHWSASFELREGGTAHEGVMTGLDPVIHENTAHQDKHLIRNSILLRQRSSRQGGVDGRHKAGHDGLKQKSENNRERYKSRIVGAANRRNLPSPLRARRPSTSRRSGASRRGRDKARARTRRRVKRPNRRAARQPSLAAWTGPESLPLASTSRSTNSITAIAALSPGRNPAFMIRV